MAAIEARLAALGITLPPPVKAPPGVVLPFRFVRIVGDRALISGHGPQAPDGEISGPFGRVGGDLTVEQGYAAARLVGISMLGSLRRALGDLDRIRAWGRVFGMVSSVPGFGQHPAVINGFSDLIHEVFGPEVGAHSRSAIGVVSLPWGIPVEIEGEVLIAP